MRRLLNAAIFSALLVSVFTTQAQMTLIPKAGATYSNLMVSDEFLDGTPKPESKIGFVLGAALEIGLNDKLAIQPELLFLQKGAMQKDSGDGYEEKQTFTINYLELPVMVKVKFSNFYVNAGPSLSYGLGGKAKYEATDGNNTFETSGKIKFGDEPDDNEDDFYLDNAMDIGIQVGAGGKVGPLVVDLRYGLGMTNLLDEPEGFPGDWKFKNGSFQLTVGFPIPVGQ